VGFYFIFLLFPRQKLKIRNHSFSLKFSIFAATHSCLETREMVKWLCLHHMKELYAIYVVYIIMTAYRYVTLFYSVLSVAYRAATATVTNPMSALFRNNHAYIQDTKLLQAIIIAYINSSHATY